MTHRPFPHTRFDVGIYAQPESGLLMAVSKEIEGFSLAASSIEEMHSKLLSAIQEFLAFSGYAPGTIKMEKIKKVGDFNPPQYTFEVQPIAA